MSSGPGHLALAAVLRAMAEDDTVVDEVVAAARDGSPEVARLPAAETRRHVAVVLSAALAALEQPGAGGGTPHSDTTGDGGPAAGTAAAVYRLGPAGRGGDGSGEDLAAAELLGADRAAQGVPITALLRGVQAGRERAVRIALGRARAAGIPPEQMLDALLDVDRYTGALERHVVAGYHTAELELARTARDARTRLLRRLLTDDADLPGPEEIRAAGLQPESRYHCLVSDLTDPVRARALEQQLGTQGAVFGLLDGRLTGLTPRLPTVDGLRGRTLVLAAPAVPPDGLRVPHRLCLAALDAAAGRGLTGLHLLTDLAAGTALASQPELAGLLADTVLGALDPGDRFHRRLAATALAYLDHGQRLDLTADALGLHPNTVRYRLTRLAELAGPLPAPTAGLLATLHWWWALSSWLTPTA